MLLFRFSFLVLFITRDYSYTLREGFFLLLTGRPRYVAVGYPLRISVFVFSYGIYAMALGVGSSKIYGDLVFLFGLFIFFCSLFKIDSR